jgi:hypothetical protein
LRPAQMPSSVVPMRYTPSTTPSMTCSRPIAQWPPEDEVGGRAGDAPARAGLGPDGTR